jgi:hypothetical protein
MTTPPETALTVEQWKRRALRAEAAIRHALWMSPLTYSNETAAQMRDRFHQHIEATYPDLITRYEHQPAEVFKWADSCDCKDDGSNAYEADHCEEGDDGPICSRSPLGMVCGTCRDEDGDGPDWSPDAVEWPCPSIREINAAEAVRDRPQLSAIVRAALEG